MRKWAMSSNSSIKVEQDQEKEEHKSENAESTKSGAGLRFSRVCGAFARVASKMILLLSCWTPE